MGWMRHSRLLRSAVENPRIQIAFHVGGGVGCGLLLARFMPPEAAAAVGVLLVGAAILGHWYAVWSDPHKARPVSHGDG